MSNPMFEKEEGDDEEIDFEAESSILDEKYNYYIYTVFS